MGQAIRILSWLAGITILTGCIPLGTVYGLDRAYVDSTGVCLVACEYRISQFIMPVPPSCDLVERRLICTSGQSNPLPADAGAPGLQFRREPEWTYGVPVAGTNLYARFTVDGSAERTGRIFLETFPLDRGAPLRRIDVGRAIVKPPDETSLTVASLPMRSIVEDFQSWDPGSARLCFLTAVDAGNSVTAPPHWDDPALAFDLRIWSPLERSIRQQRITLQELAGKMR